MSGAGAEPCGAGAAPEPQAGARRTLACPACRQPVRTSAAPGRPASCRKCGEQFRVPLAAAAGGSRVAFACPACAEAVETTRPPGQKARCGACGEAVRVPLKSAAAAASAFSCPECGEETTSPAAPGKRTACRACGARIRVPLRDAAETAPAAAGRDGPRRCPDCGTELPGALGACPECRLGAAERGPASLGAAAGFRVPAGRAGAILFGAVLAVGALLNLLANPGGAVDRSLRVKATRLALPTAVLVVGVLVIVGALPWRRARDRSQGR